MTSLQDLLPEPGTSNWRKSKSYSTDSGDIDDASVRHVVIREVWLENRPTPHAVYKIDVMSKSAHWSVFRRYREFYQLYQLLLKRYGIPKELLPPRKLTNSLAKDTLYKRREALEHFLQRIINSSGRGVSCCDEVLEFLDVKSHDVSLVSHTLAKYFKEKGDAILASGEGFQFTPSQLYCITKQLRLPHPWAGQRVDLSHLYDFVTRVQKVVISDLVATASRGQQHLSNVCYDVSLFTSLRELQLDGCQISCISGLSALPIRLVKLAARYSVRSMKEILVDSATETRKAPVVPNTADNWRTQAAVKLVENRMVVQPWVCLSSVNLSHNNISSLDSAFSLLPAIKELDLSYNRITHVDLALLADSPLQRLSLVANEVYLLSGSTKTNEQLLALNLRSNRIHTIEGLLCLQRLESLDLAQNSIVLMAEIRKLGALLRLRRVWIAGNPIAKRKRHRIMTLYYFRSREIELDGKPMTGKEKAKIDAKVRQFGDESVGPDDGVSISTVSDDDLDSGIDEHGHTSRLEPLLEEEYYIVGRDLEPVCIVRELPDEDEPLADQLEGEYLNEQGASTGESRSRDEWDKILSSKSISEEKETLGAGACEPKPTLLVQSQWWTEDSQRVSVFERLNAVDLVSSEDHTVQTSVFLTEGLSDTCVRRKKCNKIHGEGHRARTEGLPQVREGTLLFKSLSLENEETTRENESNEASNASPVATVNVPLSLSSDMKLNVELFGDATSNDWTDNDEASNEPVQNDASNVNARNPGDFSLLETCSAEGASDIMFQWSHFVPPPKAGDEATVEGASSALPPHLETVEEVRGTEWESEVLSGYEGCERAEECNED